MAIPFIKSKKFILGAVGFLIRTFFFTTRIYEKRSLYVKDILWREWCLLRMYAV
jgi:hypothetical protein